MKKIFYNANVLTPNGVIQNGAVLTDGGKITEICTRADICADEKTDCEGNYLVAGFVDVHCHGGGGADFMDGSIEAIERAVHTHLLHGTTTICPTTMSAEMREIENTFEIFRAFKNTSRYAVNTVGLHLEGPFLSPQMVGAQRPDLIIAPTEKEIHTLKKNADIISRISCAPEVVGVQLMANALLPYGIQ